MDVLSTFRHDPVKARIGGKQTGSFAWRTEPAVMCLRRFELANKRLGRVVDVPVSATPVVVEDIGVVVASDDGFVRLLSRNLAKSYWERRLSSSIYASLVVDPVRSRVIVCDTAGLVCAFDLKGRLCWSSQLGLPIFATPAIHVDEDLLMLACFGNTAFGLSLSSGKTRYTVALPSPWYAVLDTLVSRRNPYASPAACPDGTAVHCSGSYILAIARGGQELWRCDVGAHIISSPAVVPSERCVVVADVSGSCHILDLREGSLRVRLDLGAKVVASGAVSNGIVALGDTCGRVWGVDAGTGQITWTSPLGAPNEYGSMTLTPRGDFVATNAKGNAVCLAAEDGRFLWETSQVMGLPDQSTRMDCTPVVGASGFMFGGSYDGTLYQFAFRPQQGESTF